MPKFIQHTSFITLLRGAIVARCDNQGVVVEPEIGQGIKQSAKLCIGMI